MSYLIILILLNQRTEKVSKWIKRDKRRQRDFLVMIRWRPSYWVSMDKSMSWMVRVRNHNRLFDDFPVSVSFIMLPNGFTLWPKTVKCSLLVILRHIIWISLQTTPFEIELRMPNYDGARPNAVKITLLRGNIRPCRMSFRKASAVEALASGKILSWSLAEPCERINFSSFFGKLVEN